MQVSITSPASGSSVNKVFTATGNYEILPGGGGGGTPGPGPVPIPLAGGISVSLDYGTGVVPGVVIYQATGQFDTSTSWSASFNLAAIAGTLTNCKLTVTLTLNNNSISKTNTGITVG